VTRVYNPIKQAQDHDEKGYFVRKWLPYMRQVPDTWIFEPWKMTADMHSTIGSELSKKIPMPIVDLTAATKTSKDRLYERRNLSEVREGKKSVVEKHASRASNTYRSGSKAKTADTKQQLNFEF
jgi:deoxyribodipyrimidine photo-lyase